MLDFPVGKEIDVALFAEGSRHFLERSRPEDIVKDVPVQKEAQTAFRGILAQPEWRLEQGVPARIDRGPVCSRHKGGCAVLARLGGQAASARRSGPRNTFITIEG